MLPGTAGSSRKAVKRIPPKNEARGRKADLVFMEKVRAARPSLDALMDLWCRYRHKSAHPWKRVAINRAIRAWIAAHHVT